VTVPGIRGPLLFSVKKIAEGRKAGRASNPHAVDAVRKLEAYK